MNCGEAKQILMDIALDETTPEQQPDLRSHLEGCVACRAELAGLSLSRKLLQQGLPLEEVPRRIAFVASAPAAAAKPGWWLWRPFALPFAAAAMVLMVVGTLAVARTSITVDQGRWAVAFGVTAPAAAAATVIPTAAPASAGNALFNHEQVQSLIAAAVRDSEARQRAETSALITAATNRIEQREYVALSALAEQMRYFRSTQATFYKENEGTRMALQNIASRLPAEKVNP